LPLAPTAVRVDVYRSALGRELRMRGGFQAAVSGALTRIDFEIPFNTPVTYWAEMFDVAGLSLGMTDRTTTTLYSTLTWMHNPLDPRGAVQVEMADTAARSFSRPSGGEIVHPLGRSFGVVISSGRSGLRDLVMDCYTATLEDADKVQAMFGTYSRGFVPVACIRVGSTMRVPKPLFLGVLDAVEEDVDIRYGGTFTAHRLTGDEVSPPTPALVVPLLTRADLNSYYPTRAALNADHVSRLEVNRHYSLAGTADQ